MEVGKLSPLSEDPPLSTLNGAPGLPVAELTHDGRHLHLIDAGLAFGGFGDGVAQDRFRCELDPWFFGALSQLTMGAFHGFSTW